jgi:hypothetical protein
VATAFVLKEVDSIEEPKIAALIKKRRATTLTKRATYNRNNFLHANPAPLAAAISGSQNLNFLNSRPDLSAQGQVNGSTLSALLPRLLFVTHSGRKRTFG